MLVCCSVFLFSVKCSECTERVKGVRESGFHENVPLSKLEDGDEVEPDDEVRLSKFGDGEIMIFLPCGGEELDEDFCCGGNPSNIIKFCLGGGRSPTRLGGVNRD